MKNHVYFEAARRLLGHATTASAEEAMAFRKSYELVVQATRIADDIARAGHPLDIRAAVPDLIGDGAVLRHTTCTRNTSLFASDRGQFWIIRRKQWSGSDRDVALQCLEALAKLEKGSGVLNARDPDPADVALLEIMLGDWLPRPDDRGFNILTTVYGRDASETFNHRVVSA